MPASSLVYFAVTDVYPTSPLSVLLCAYNVLNLTVRFTKLEIVIT